MLVTHTQQHSTLSHSVDTHIVVHDSVLMSLWDLFQHVQYHSFAAQLCTHAFASSVLSLRLSSTPITMSGKGGLPQTGYEPGNDDQTRTNTDETSPPKPASKRVSFGEGDFTDDSMHIQLPEVQSIGSQSRFVPQHVVKRGVTTTTKISTKNDFDGDASKFPVWRLKQLAIFRSIKVSRVLDGPRPDALDPQHLEWSELNTQLHDHLILNLDASSLLLVRDCSERADGRSAWERLCGHYDGNTGISKQSLLNKLFHLQMTKGEAPHDFALRIKRIADQLAFNHSAPQSDENLITILLTRLTSEYSIIGTVLTQQLETGHISTLSEVVRALRDDWERKQVSKSFIPRSSDPSSAHNAYQPNAPNSKFTGKCHNCGKQGHKKADCRSKKGSSSGGSSGSSDSKGNEFACSFHKTNKHSDSECNAQKARRNAGKSSPSSSNSSGSTSGESSNSGGEQQFGQAAIGGASQHFSCAAIRSHRSLAFTSVRQQPKVWIHVDSCASSHILDPALCKVNGSSAIFDLKQLDQPESIKVGGGYTFATHTGSLRIQVTTASGQRGVIYITEALVVEGFGSLLLSLVNLENKHDAHVSRSGPKRVLCFGGGKFLLSTRCNIYSIAATIMHAPQASASIAASSNSDNSTNTSLQHITTTDTSSIHVNTPAKMARAPPVNADVWHARMGHANMRQVETAAAIEGNGVTIHSKLYTGRCTVCPLGKSHQQPHPVPPTPSRADAPAAMVMMDVFGPLPEPSLGGARFAVGIVDSHTRMVFLYTTSHHTADNILDIWQHFITRHVIPQGLHVRRLRTDNASEFGSDAFMSYNHRAGIIQEFSSPYTPQQLGMVESVWKPLTAFMRMTLAETQLPAGLWAEILHAKVHIRNRLPYMTNPEQMSPYRMWFGKEPNLSHLRVIGSAAFVHEERGGSKLLPRAWQGRLVGYNHDGHMHDSISYRVYNPADSKVYASRNVTIIEPLIEPRSEANSGTNKGTTYTSDSNSSTSTASEQTDVEVDSSDSEAESEVWSIQDDDDTSVNASDVRATSQDGRIRTQSKSNDASHTESCTSTTSRAQHHTIEGFDPYAQHNTSTLPTLPTTATTSASSPTAQSDELHTKSTTPVPATGGTRVTESGTNTNNASSTDETAHADHSDSHSNTAPLQPAAARRKAKSTAKGGVVSKYKLRSGKSTGLLTTHTPTDSTTLSEQWTHKHLVLPAYTVSLADTSYAFVAEESVAPRDAILPRTHEEAVSCNERDAWLAAEQAEITSLQAFNVFTWVTPPADARIHKSRWVYAHKRNSVGDIVRCKARFVACGYSQVKGQDYDDAFAPVARMSTYRSCIAFAAYNDYEIRQLDVKTAFLQADLLETTYVYPPVGYSKTDKRGQQQVWRLNRSLYGLVQAARCWYLSISTHLTSHGFKQSDADPCLFTDTNNTIIVLYVDDMLVIGSSRTNIQQAVDVLRKSYDIKDIGELEYCLGIAVKRNKQLHTCSHAITTTVCRGLVTIIRHA